MCIRDSNEGWAEGRGGSGRVLFFGIVLYKVAFFGRILCRRCCVIENVGRFVTGGVFAAGFRGRFVGLGEAESGG